MAHEIKLTDGTVIELEAKPRTQRLKALAKSLQRRKSVANIYDEKCYDLAVHFLADHPRTATEARAMELAVLIQQECERYIDHALTEEEHRD